MKPYVLIARDGQRLPFDLADFRTIFYSLELEQFEKAQNELIAQLQKIANGEVYSYDIELFGYKNELTDVAITSTNTQTNIIEIKVYPVVKTAFGLI